MPPTEQLNANGDCLSTWDNSEAGTKIHQCKLPRVVHTEYVPLTRLAVPSSANGFYRLANARFMIRIK
jgi:hypothetical protein